MHRFSFQLLILFLFTTSTLFAEPLRLGLSAPLSGGGAAWGNDAKNVLEFANEKLANNTYKLIFEDDRCDPKTALTVARKLSSVDKVDVAFLVCGQATMAATKAYRQSEVSVVATLATPSSISGSGAWRTSLNDARASQKLSQVIANKTDAISVLTEENDYSVSFFKDFAEAAKKDELRVENEYYLSSQTDFRAQLLKLKNKGAKAVFLNTQTEEALANILKQMKLLNFSPLLFGAYLPGSEHFLEIGGELAEGLIFVDFPGAEELLTTEGKALYQEFVSRYGPIQGWSFAFPATFEAFRAVHMGLSSQTPLETYLRKTTFQGIIGEYRFDRSGDIVGPQHVVRVVRNGKSQPYDR